MVLVHSFIRQEDTALSQFHSEIPGGRITILDWDRSKSQWLTVLLFWPSGWIPISVSGFLLIVLQILTAICGKSQPTAIRVYFACYYTVPCHTQIHCSILEHVWFSLLVFSNKSNLVGYRLCDYYYESVHWPLLQTSFGFVHYLTPVSDSPSLQFAKWVIMHNSILYPFTSL